MANVVQIKARSPSTKVAEIVSYCVTNGIKFNTIYSEETTETEIHISNGDGFWNFVGNSLIDLESYFQWVNTK